MPLSTVDNTAFDAALAAVAATYDGPWTRTGTTTDLDTNPMISPNSDVTYHVKTTSGYDVYASYDMLGSTAKLRDLAMSALGVNWLLRELETWVAALNAIIGHANFDPLTAPESYWQILLKFFWAMPMLGIQVPFDAYKEVANEDFKNTPVDASFTLVDASDVATVTNTSTGLYHFGIIYWGDGHMELIDTKAAQPTIVHDYAHASAATYTIRMTLIGPNGMDTATDTITVT